MKGLVYAKNTFNLEDFRFEVDLSVSNKQRTTMAKGDFRLFILRDNPMRSVGEFAHGLDGEFDGIELHLREGYERNPDRSKGAQARVHSLEARIKDDKFESKWDTKTLKDNKKNGKNKGIFGLIPPPKDCFTTKEDMTLFIEVKNRTVQIGYKGETCYEYLLPEHYFSEDHDAYIFMSGYSGNGIPNKHVIHEARFIDSKHLHDRQEIDSEKDR